MAIYAGEIVHIYNEALDYKGVSFTEDDNVTVALTIWDLDDNVIVDAEPMTYGATAGPEDEPGWLYHWASPAGEPGSYLSAVHITGSNVDSWEYLNVRLKADKAPA